MIIDRCTFFNGSVTISENAPLDVEFKGIRSMRKLEISSVKDIRSIFSHSLESVDEIRLTDLPKIVFLNFSALSVLEEIRLENLPSFENCSLGLGPRTKATLLNTGLQKIDWLKWPVTTALNIAGNTNLESVSLPWDTINGNITIEENKSLRNVSASGIKDVTGSFKLSGSGEMEGFEFPNLETVVGEVNLSGAFTNISFPALKSVEGGLKLESSQDINDICNSLVAEKLKGRFVCRANIRKEGSQGPSSIPSNESSGNIERPSSDLPQDPDQSSETDIALGAKIGIILASLILAIFVFVGIFFLIRARIRGKVLEIVPTAPGTPMVVSKSAGSVMVPKSEETVVRVVKINLNGQEMKEEERNKTEIAKVSTSVGKEIDRELSLRSVSSMGSVGDKARLTEERVPPSPVSPV